MERTVAIVKPLACQKGDTGKIITEIEDAGFAIPMIYRTQFSREEGAYFYEMHKDKPFYGELVDFITSGPVVVMVLEKENAIEALRTLIGTTDPAQAAPETIRARYGTSMGKNAIHGSDSPASAEREMAFVIGRQRGCGKKCQCGK